MTDSLNYVGKRNQIQKNKILQRDYKREIQVAESLYRAGLYSDAVNALQTLILEDHQKSLGSTLPQTHSPDKPGIRLAEITTFFNYNQVIDYNEKLLQVNQKDSAFLRKNMRTIYGLRTKFYWPIDFYGFYEIQPYFYAVNITFVPNLTVKGAFLNNSVFLNNNVAIEKLIGRYTIITTGTNTGNSKYTWIGTESDSSDVIRNTFQLEWNNSALNSSDLFLAVPFKWYYIKFRHNKPVLSARQSYSLNPSLEYRFSTVDLSISARWFSEYISYFGSGKSVPRDTTTIPGDTNITVPVKRETRYYNTPEVKIEYHFQRLSLTLFESVMSNIYPNSYGILEKIKKEVTDFNNPAQFNVKTTEFLKNSLWMETRGIVSYRFKPWLTVRLNATYLIADDLYHCFKYRTAGEPEITDLRLKGTDLILVPEIELRYSQTLKIGANFLYEDRDAPVIDSLALGYQAPSTIKYTQRYIWEKYKAYEPGITVRYENHRLQMRMSETLRIEDVVADSSYEICDSKTWNTKATIGVTFFQRYSFFINAVIGSKTNDLKTLLSKTKIIKDRKLTNIDLSTELSVKF